MRFLHFVFIPFAIVACGGAAGTGLDDGGPDASDGAASNDGTTTDAVANPDGGPACPTESGQYSIQLSGAGCGDTSTSPLECITQNQCNIQLDFNGGNGKALKGQTPIQSDGSFASAAIEEGSLSRTGCTGTWTQATHTLVVDCGGTNTSQSCVATLVRTSETCK
jgi:hypothetical protein